jgi:hypothetical protein
MGDWVHGLAPWQVISHLTFSWEASFDSARRCYEKFMRTDIHLQTPIYRPTEAFTPNDTGVCHCCQSVEIVDTEFVSRFGVAGQ